MNKTTRHYGAFLQPFTLVTALMLAMISEDGQHLLWQWASLSLLWLMAFWVLRQFKSIYLLGQDKAFLSYVLFVAWAVFSSVFLSSAKSISILVLTPFVGGLLSYLIAYAGNEQKERYVDQLLLLIGLLLVVYTCYQKFYLGMVRPIGLLRNWNTHAALLSMIVLPWILRYALKPVVHIWKIAGVSFIALLFTFAMGLTLSRGALLIVVVSVFCLLIFAWRQRLFFRHSIVLIAALIVGYLLNGVFVGETMVQRLGVISHADSLSAIGSGRHLLWLPAWEMYLDRPFLGWGLGTFRFLYLQYKPPLSVELGHYVHNDYLQFLVELGPIGFLLFVVFCYFLIGRLWVLLFSKTENVAMGTVQGFVFLVISVGMLAHTFFSFNLCQLTMQIIFGSYLGRSARHLRLQSVAELAAQEGAKAIPKKWGLIYYSFAGLISVSMLCLGASFYYLTQAGQTQNKQQALDDYWQAGLFFPALERYDSLSALSLSKQLNSGQLDVEVRQKVAIFALTQVDAAIDKMPYNIRNYITKASILQMMGAKASVVIEQYQQALKIDPSALGVRHIYARYLLSRKQYSKALTILWGAWGRFYRGSYQPGINLLSYQLELNKQYGRADLHSIIEQAHRHLIELNSRSRYGEYILKKGEH